MDMCRFYWIDLLGGKNAKGDSDGQVDVDLGIGIPSTLSVAGNYGMMGRIDVQGMY